MQVLDAAVVSGLLDAFRRMVAQNDQIIGLLGQIAAHEAALTRAQDQTMELVAMLVATSLNSAPRTTRAIPVGVTETLLAENQSEPLMMVEITNHDPAQAMQVGGQGVTILAGHEVAPLTTVPFVLPLGQMLYGVCTAAVINVSIAITYPPVQLVNAIKDSIQWTQAQR